MYLTLNRKQDQNQNRADSDLNTEHPVYVVRPGISTKSIISRATPGVPTMSILSSSCFSVSATAGGGQSQRVPLGCEADGLALQASVLTVCREASALPLSQTKKRTAQAVLGGRQAAHRPSPRQSAEKG